MRKTPPTSHNTYYKNFKNTSKKIIWTGNYFSVWGRKNVIRISNGLPKGFMVCDEIKELYPKWVWVKYHLPWDKFVPLYNEQLAKLDVHEIAKRCEGKILCCYEKDLTKDHCHRELVRQWLLQNGYSCEEIS